MKKRILYTIAALVVLGAVGVAAWYIYKPATDNAAQTKTTDTEQVDVNRPNQSEKDQAVTTTLKLYYIGLEDKSTASGDKIGCGDIVVATLTEPVTTTNKLLDSMKRLVSEKSQYIGQSGLYNALYTSDLSVKKAVVVDDTAEVTLTGRLSLGGECDSPRVKHQLEDTAMEASGASKVTITINGKSLDEALSLK